MVGRKKTMVTRAEFLDEHQRIVSKYPSLTDLLELESIFEYPLDEEWGWISVEAKAGDLSPHELYATIQLAIEKGDFARVYAMLPQDIMYPVAHPDEMQLESFHDTRKYEQYAIVGREALLAITSKKE